MARNLTATTKRGGYVTKSYTQATPMATKTAAEVLRNSRSAVFSGLAKGVTVAETLSNLEMMAAIYEDFGSAKTWTRSQTDAVLAGTRLLYTEVKHIGAGIYLAFQGAQVAPASTLSPVPNGIYTVVMGSERRTIRVRDDWRADAPKGSQVAQVLTGPTNTTDYTGFAFLSGTTIRMWKKYQGDNRINPAMAALAFLLGGRENWENSGKVYAKESGNCYRCSRVLTTPESIARGIGPECAKKSAA